MSIYGIGGNMMYDGHYGWPANGYSQASHTMTAGSGVARTVNRAAAGAENTAAAGTANAAAVGTANAAGTAGSANAGAAPGGANPGGTAADKPRTAAEMQMLKQMGKAECETCKNRTYQDGSNDPGVSFKAPGHIDPESSGAAVRAHEQEHVANEQAKARVEGKRVISQSVRIFTSVCPECGRAYVSGGVTRTVTASGGNRGSAISQYNKNRNMSAGSKINSAV